MIAGMPVQKLYSRYVYPFKDIIEKYQRYGVPFEELVCEAECELLKAIELFDRSGSTDFLTYASWRIKWRLSLFADV